MSFRTSSVAFLCSYSRPPGLTIAKGVCISSSAAGITSCASALEHSRTEVSSTIPRRYSSVFSRGPLMTIQPQR